MKYTELIDTEQPQADVMAAYRRKPVSELTDAELEAEYQGLQTAKPKPVSELTDEELNAELAAAALRSKLKDPSKPESSWYETIKPSTIVPQIGAMAGQWLGGRLQSIQENAPKVGDKLGGALGEMPADKYPIIPKDAGKQVYDYYTKSLESASPNVPKGSAKDYVNQILTNVGMNLPTMLYGGLTGQANKALIAMGELAAGQKYGEMRAAQKAATPLEAGIGSTISGISEAATEKLPLEALIKPGISFTKRLLLSAGLDLPGEEINTVVNSVIDKLTIKPDMTLNDYWSDFKDTAIITLGSAGLLTGIMHPIVKHTQSKEQGTQAAPSLDEIFTQTEPSATEGAKPASQMSDEELNAEWERIQAQQQQEQEAAVMPEVQAPVEEMASQEPITQISPLDDLVGQMSTTLQTMYNAQKVHNVNSGMTEDQARAAAFEYVQNTPQGKIDLEKIKAQQAQAQADSQQTIIEEQAKEQAKIAEEQQKEATTQTEKLQQEPQTTQATQPEQAHEALDITTIPENLTIDERVMNKAGEAATAKSNAREAYTASQERINKYKSLLECLRA